MQIAKMKKNKVIIIAPHLDDEVLGCGGVILKHKERRDTVYVVFVANRVYGHVLIEKDYSLQKQHALNARRILGYDQAFFLDLPDERLDASVQDIIIPLEKIVTEIKPDMVYVPFRGDNNQDHRAVFDAARVVLRPGARHFVKKILMFEVPSSTDQSPPLAENAFLPNYYVNIFKYLNRKLNAFGCYLTEKRRFPNLRSRKALSLRAKIRGVEAGFDSAEAFVLLRDVWL